MWHANILRHHDKCLIQSGADPELASRVIPYGEYVDDHKVMCYMRCIGENLNLVYSDNSINHQNFLDILYVDEPKLLAKAKFVEKCFDIHLKDECESAYRVSECVYKSIQNVMDDEESNVQ